MNKNGQEKAAEKKIVTSYPFMMEPTYIPPSPPLLLCPTILIPRKLILSG